MPKANPAPFDLGAVRYKDTLEYEILHVATGEPTGWVWTLAGPAHPQTLAAEEANFRRQQDEREKQQQEAIEAVKASKPVPSARRTLSEIRQQNAMLLSSRVLKWSDVVVNGEALPFTPQAALDILSDPNTDWIAHQIDAALGAKANFLPNSAAT